MRQHYSVSIFVSEWAAYSLLFVSPGEVSLGVFERLSPLLAFPLANVLLRSAASSYYECFGMRQREISHFWEIHPLGMRFGQDLVSTNVPKANILMDSCKDQDWGLLWHLQRVLEGEDWLGQEWVRQDLAVLSPWDSSLLRSTTGLACSTESLTSSCPCFSKSSNPLPAHGQHCQSQQHSQVMR